MRDLWTALALVLVIEGVLYALFPEGMKRAAARALLVPPQTLRLAGLRPPASGSSSSGWCGAEASCEVLGYRRC